MDSENGRNITMEVKTVHGTMDIHIGARFAEVYGHLAFPTLLIVWVVISDPKVEVRLDGSKFISWMSSNTRTGKETIMGISDRDIHYSSHIYPIDHPKIKRLMDYILNYAKSYWDKNNNRYKHCENTK